MSDKRCWVGEACRLGRCSCLSRNVVTIPEEALSAIRLVTTKHITMSKGLRSQPYLATEKLARDKANVLWVGRGVDTVWIDGVPRVRKNVSSSGQKTLYLRRQSWHGLTRGSPRRKIDTVCVERCEHRLVRGLCSPVATTAVVQHRC